MDPISFAASVAALTGVTLKTIQYLFDVKNAPNERQALTREVTDLLQMLFSLSNQVEEPQQSHAWNESLKLLATEYSAFDQLRDALEKLAKKLKSRKGIKKIAHDLAWTLDKRECEEALKKIERVKSRISLALQNDIYKLSQSIKADTAGIDIINERVLELQVTEDAKHRQQILEWFSPLNFYKTHQEILKRREEGTGQWLIDSTCFKDWVAGSHRTLCCAGIPGAGKSVLASVMVDYLRKIAPLERPYGVAAVYCNFKDRDTQSPENLIAGLCVQLVDSSILLPGTLAKLYDSHRPKQTRPTMSEVISVIVEVIPRFQDTYLVVDALDECQANVRDEIVQELKALLPNIRLLVTTRPIDSITRMFIPGLAIEIFASPGDLKTYIKSTIKRSSGLSRLLNGQDMLETEICDIIIEKANGMFLAARFHMESLATKLSVSKIRKALTNLPSTLDGLYHDVFCRIDAQSEDLRLAADKALRWIAYAYRPLYVDELGEALAIEPEGEDFDPDAIPDIDLVLEACAGLVIVDEETELIRLVHYTAQDYLDKLLASRFNGAHASIARDCLTYLSYDVIQSSKSESESVSEDQGESDDDRNGLECHLLDYVVLFWAQHYTKGDDASPSAQLHDFLVTNPQVYLDTSFYRHFRIKSPADLESCSGIGIAAYHGLDDALSLLLQNGANINEITYEDHSALHLAALGGNITAIEMLLNYGADIECRGEFGEGTPLHVAIEHDKEGAARLLVDRGANVVTVDRDEVSPFAEVPWDSPISFLQILLNRGGDINSRGICGQTQLLMRVENDDVETVQWLLEQGASVNLRDDAGRTGLHYAAELKSATMTRLLLDKGALINVEDQESKTALHDAAENGNIDIVELLLRGNAPVNIVQKCLEVGTDVDATTISGDTPLHLAAREGYNEIIRLLIAHNAKVNKRDSEGRTPLMSAVESSKTSADFDTAVPDRLSTDIVHTLINAGSRTDIQDHHACNTLHYAAARGKTAAARKLLNNHSVAPTARCRLTLTVKVPKRLYGSRGVFEPEINIKKDGYNIYFYDSRKERFLELDDRYIRMNIQEFRGERFEIRFWKDGMTALDIAVLSDHEDCVQYLEPLTGTRTESQVLSSDEFLCELFGFSSITDLEREVERWGEVEVETDPRIRE